MEVTYAALNAWARTVPPHSLWWIDDHLWERIWRMLQRDARFPCTDEGYRWPIISWRQLHENVQIGRRSARDEYRRLKGRL